MAKPQTTTELRLERLERAVTTMAEWLVEAQTGFGENDARGISDILEGKDEIDSEKSDAP